MDTSNPFHADHAADAAEKHADSVDFMIDQIFAAMVKNTDKKHYAMSQLVENLPISMEIFNDRSAGSPTNSKYIFENMG